MKSFLKEYFASALLWPRVLVIGIFAYIGFMLFSSGHANTLSVAPEVEHAVLAGNAASIVDANASESTAVQFGGMVVASAERALNDAKLRPVAHGFMPSAYLPWGDLTMAEHSKETGTKHYFAANIQGEGCTPYWGGNLAFGLASNRSRLIKQDIAAIRAAGGDVAVSFDGSFGTDLAVACTTTAALQGAYQKVITEYGVRHIDLTISGTTLYDQRAVLRLIMAAQALQRADPELHISVTMPADQQGLLPDQLTVLRKFREAGIVLSNIGLQTYNFGNDFKQPAASRVVAATDAALLQLRGVYPQATPAQLAKALMIVTKIGRNDTRETFTLADATTVRDYARTRGIGTLSFWAAGRDQACGSVFNATILRDTCSQVTQTRYQFAGIYRQAY